ncbi:MAG TPA: ankyrin repeat domain-containing protein [Candidatus Limnocylindrales bacterium]|nr:ankyrin repeat domain-containing protein [Candidatus Limnocylindrales bacterium]
MRDLIRPFQSITVALLVLSSGCFLLPPPHSDYRPIHQFSLGCDAQAVQAILQTNVAAVNLPDDSGRTPLHDAASRNCTNVIAILIHAGAQLEARDQAGETPLHVAAQEGCTDAVTLLVQAGANINPIDNQGNTPLKRARAYEQTAVVNLLRSLGAKE